MPDASQYGDTGSNTLSNLARALEKNNQSLRLPNLTKLGLHEVTPLTLNSKTNTLPIIGAYGKAFEKSQGKDTTSGHWEMAGFVVSKAFETYPHGFSPEIIERFVSENHLPGILGNKAASGTTIIDELGIEHMETGKPIVYTSADSVWQIAAHEETFGLEKLYKVCKSARLICDELGISRVIARPFIGDPRNGKPFQRTYHRKDYSQKPGQATVLNHLVNADIPVLGIGKISACLCGCWPLAFTKFSLLIWRYSSWSGPGFTGLRCSCLQTWPIIGPIA
jgi:phosphopentomutase